MQDLIRARRDAARRPRAALLALALFAGGVDIAFAQDAEPGSVEALRAEIAALRAEQAERDQRIERLETALDRIAGGPGAAAAGAPAVVDAGTHAGAGTQAPPAATAIATAPATATATDDAPRLKVSGDLRLRGQADWSDEDGKNRGSMQVRGRLGATFAVNERVTIGARLATGDSDDPNSSDVQLSNWLDDLEVSLDMAYVQFNFDRLTLYGGKMPQPFARTDLVWDGDVNPQGLGATWKQPLAGGGTLRANGLAFIVDESAGGPDSTMLGAQLGYDSPQRGDWRFDANLAYYHYDLGSLAGADAGDLRTNLLDADGRYLSEFRLANLLLGATWTGLGEQWPLRLVVDYVHNTGAATDADTGYSAEIGLGKAAVPGDWRVAYGYSMAQADAVLTAFSQDNIGIGSNYRVHGLTVDYVPLPKTMLSLYWYHYRPDSRLYPVGQDPDDWLDRLRLAFLVNF